MTPITIEAQSQADKKPIKYKKSRVLQKKTATKMADVYEALELVDEKGEPAPDMETVLRILNELRKDQQNLKSYDRSVMWNAQTPQIFRSKRLQYAYENFSGDYSNATDEAAIFDELEDDVVLYENSSNNLKITLSDDLKLAEFMMKEKDL